MNKPTLYSFLVLLCAGCAATAPQQMYAGEPRPKDQVAIIKSKDAPSLTFLLGTVLSFLVERSPGTGIVKVDGQPVDASSVEVLPGRHTVNVKLSGFYLGMVSGSKPKPGRSYDIENHADLDLIAKAGRTYQVNVRVRAQSGEDGYTEAWLWYWWIEDTESREVVAGDKPTSS